MLESDFVLEGREESWLSDFGITRGSGLCFGLKTAPVGWKQDPLLAGRGMFRLSSDLWPSSSSLARMGFGLKVAGVIGFITGENRCCGKALFSISSPTSDWSSVSDADTCSWQLRSMPSGSLPQPPGSALGKFFILQQTILSAAIESSWASVISWHNELSKLLLILTYQGHRLYLHRSPCALHPRCHHPQQPLHTVALSDPCGRWNAEGAWVPDWLDWCPDTVERATSWKYNINKPRIIYQCVQLPLQSQYSQHSASWINVRDTNKSITKYWYFNESLPHAIENKLTLPLQRTPCC